jgi:hypothetical protein
LGEHRRIAGRLAGGAAPERRSDALRLIGDRSLARRVIEAFPAPP